MVHFWSQPVLRAVKLLYFNLIIDSSPVLDINPLLTLLYTIVECGKRQKTVIVTVIGSNLHHYRPVSKVVRLTCLCRRGRFVWDQREVSAPGESDAASCRSNHTHTGNALSIANA